MPSIHGSLTHVPRPKQTRGQKAKEAFNTKVKGNPRVRRGKHYASAARGNVTSTKAKNYETGDTIGRPKFRMSEPETFEEALEGIGRQTQNLSGKFNAAVVGTSAGGIAGTNLADRQARKRKQGVSKARYVRITDVGTKANTNLPHFPAKQLVGGIAVGSTVGYKAADTRHKQMEARAAKRKQKKVNTIAKYEKLKREPKYTGGRAATATLMGPYHSLVAGKQGRKARSAGRSIGYSQGAGLVGGAVGAAATKGSVGGQAIGGTAAGLGGSYAAFRQNNKRGHYKKQKVKKSSTESAFGVDHG